MPGIVARVVKQDGSLARVGETGELVIRSPSLALKYLNNEQA
jgi:acyl-coenzyme A synthetase/AMP-(fatty) acid ligase